MKKYIALIIVLVLAAASICGYGIWKNNQHDKWNVNLVQPVEDETTIVYYDNPIKSDTGVIGIWNKNEFPVDVYFYPYDGDSPVYGGEAVSKMDIPADSQTIGIPLDIDKKYTLGIHADVTEGAEIKLVVQDGNMTID